MHAFLICAFALFHSFICSLSSSAQAALRKYRRLCGLNNRHLFLTVLEAGKYKIKVPVVSVLGEGPFLGFPTATFSLYLHMVERGSAGLLLSL